MLAETLLAEYLPLESGWFVYGPENGCTFSYPCLSKVKPLGAKCYVTEVFLHVPSFSPFYNSPINPLSRGGFVYGLEKGYNFPYPRLLGLIYECELANKHIINK